MTFECAVFRRVHVTQSVVEWLSGDYEVEPGHGANRSEYLYKHNITTYLIKYKQSRMKVLFNVVVVIIIIIITIIILFRHMIKASNCTCINIKNIV